MLRIPASLRSLYTDRFVRFSVKYLFIYEARVWGRPPLVVCHFPVLHDRGTDASAAREFVRSLPFRRDYNIRIILLWHRLDIRMRDHFSSPFRIHIIMEIRPQKCVHTIDVCMSWRKNIDIPFLNFR